MASADDVSWRAAIVVPCFNEERRLDMRCFVEFLSERSDIFFLFVNDGSTDGTEEILSRVTEDLAERSQVVSLPYNRGKAEAVRAGIQHILSSCDTEFVGYWDADLATPLAEISRFLHVATARPRARFLCGSRVLTMGTDIRRSPVRHYFGRAFATGVSLTLDLPIYDTQCGAKLIERDLARLIFHEPFVSKWLFDVELLARTICALGREEARNAILEVPVEKWEDMPGSKLRLLDFVRAPLELLKIRRKYRLWKV